MCRRSESVVRHQQNQLLSRKKFRFVLSGFHRGVVGGPSLRQVTILYRPNDAAIVALMQTVLRQRRDAATRRANFTCELI